MTALPTNRTTSSTPAEHVADHNTLHDFNNTHRLPQAADAVVYVSRGSNASDANSGLSQGEAKATIAAAAAALPGTGGLIKLGYGTYTGAITLKSHVVIDGLGPELTILTIANAANTDVVKGENFDTLTRLDNNGGIVRWAIRNLTIDGNKANQTAALANPGPPTLATATTGGTLAAATHSYRIVRTNALGFTLPSTAVTQVTTGTTSTVTVTFPATVAGQTGWKVYANRGSGVEKLVATVGLVATWLDTGAVSAYGRLPDDNGTASCGLRVYGYNFTLDNVVVRNCKGWGIWSEWAAGNFEILNDGSEAELVNFKVHDNDGGGIAWRGPHDSVMKSGIVYLNGSLAALKNGVDIGAGASGLHCYAVHVWGAQCHAWPWYIHNTGTGDATTIALVDCEGEGGESGQVIIGDNDCSVIGGSYFVLDATRPVKKGIVIGDGVGVAGTVLMGAKVLNCTTAAITYANDAGSTVVLDVYQASGTVESGTSHASSRIDIRGSGARSKFPATVESVGLVTGNVGVAVPAGQSFSSGDVSLYRGDANQWRTDDSFIVVRTATNAFEVWGAVQVWGLDTTNKIMSLVNSAQLRGYSDQFGTLKYLIDASNGVAWFGLGTAGAPGVSFMGDTDTGLFSAGANTASLAGGGQEQLRVSEPGDGNVGLLLRRNVGGTLTLQQVSMGAVDSGGAGFKVLRVAN